MNKKHIFAICIVFVLLIIGNVSALGVTPARTTLDFSPGLKKSVSFSVINSEKKEVNILVAVQGSLKDNIVLSQKAFSMSKDDESRQMSYDISLPDKMEPGLHTGEIVVLQLPEESGLSEASVGAALAVITQVYVYVPYPGKYADASFNIINANSGEDATFIIPVISRGEFDLASVRANIDVYNKLNEKVASFDTDTVSIESGKRKEIVYKWKADVPVGTYRAVATLIYDGETLNLEKEFNIGNQELDLISVNVNDFSLGDIAKFEMLVENKWSEPLSEAYIQTQVFNDKQEIMADFKSSTYDISALTKKIMVSYWDTAGVKTGTYNAKMILKYAGKTNEKNVQMKVGDSSIEVIGLGYVISEGSSGSSNSLVTILVIAIVVLILINLLWFFILRKRLKK